MVQRYDAGCYYAGQDEMVEATDGLYVTYEDYQKLEAEIDQLRQQVKEPADDGWIAWDGGECPVREDAIVEIRWRDRATDIDLAGFYDWSVQNGEYSASDIIAYRIVRN